MAIRIERYDAKISDLKPTEKNPRQISKKDFETLKKSLKDFPEMRELREIVCDEEMRILGGHQRIKALKAIGETTVPVKQVFGLTESQKDEFVIKDNIANGDWDWDILANEWNQDKLEEWGLEIEGFGDEEKEIVEDLPPEAPEEPVSKVGQIWQLGDHRLMVGDSTDPKQVAKLMGGEKADLLVTDPPYNVDYEGGTGMKIANDNMDDQNFVNFLHDAFDAGQNSMKPGAAFYIWHIDHKAQDFMKAINDTEGIEYHETLIWAKNALILGHMDYQKRHEPCFYGWKTGAAHYFIDDRTQTTVFDQELDIDKLKKEEMKAMLHRIFDETNRQTIIYEDKPTRSELHPTMKPVKLIARLIENSSRERERVLDLFGGSGTTMIAAEQLNRKAYLMELDPHYADVIIQRWQDFTGQEAKLLEEL